MPGARWIDLAIVLVYLIAMALIGVRVARRQNSTEAYFVARRSIPGWAMGISIMAALISSVTFIAYPGSSYAKDWSLLVPGFMVVIVLVLAGAILIPFYREAVGMSAYEYFGRRFGQPTRVYASIAFTLAHFSKMGFVYYLVSLTVNSMTGWNLDAVTAVVGAVTIFYTVIGGIEAVIWTDVAQGIIKVAGALVCLGYLLYLPPGGPSAVFRLASENGKFSFGSSALDLSTPTVLVLVIYGFFWYLQKYTADQTIVQRYLIARSDRSAMRGVAFGALLCVPIWALFMLIGTCTWAFYRLTGEQLPAYITKADQVFPHFLSTHLPAGVAGVFMAALMSAAMSMLSSDLNCIAAVGVEDLYRHLRPDSTDRQRLRVGKILVVIFGVLGMGMALVLAHAQGSALSMWFSVSAILSGGLAGLFLLAFLSTRANRMGVYVGIGASLAFTAWATLTAGQKPLLDLGRFRYPWDDLTIGAVAHLVLWGTGYCASFLFSEPRHGEFDRSTLWWWLRQRRGAPAELARP